MAAIVKPSRQVSFSELAKADPRNFPHDRLDSQIQNLIDAIHSTQIALADIRRDDGKLKTPPAQLRERADLEKLENQLVATSKAVVSSAAAVSATAKDVHLRVKDSEIAAFTAVNSLAAVERQGATAKDAFDDAESAAERAEYAATQSENSSQYSHAQADNAIAAKVEATQWAEYLAGPVVNPADAPAYIAGHPFGHGLYYQPVDGAGGNAGLWSAKWWAIYAAQLVGPWGFYFLGSWDAPPVPGAVNPGTGVKVPTPLLPGSFYYDTTEHQLYVWDGTQWNLPFVPTVTPGFQNSYTYIATAGQTVFGGADINGFIPDVGSHPSDVHKSGLRLVYGIDYVVNDEVNTMTLTAPATAGAKVQWDLLFSQAELGATGGITVIKVAFSPVPDGAVTSFTMTYIDPGSGTQPVEVVGGQDLQVSLDGIIQEPGADYVASGNTLSFNRPPLDGARIWAIWFSDAVAEAPPDVSAPPANLVLPVVSGASTLAGVVLSATPGGWSGTPPISYSYQWKRGATNVGVNSSAYTTVLADSGSNITVVVTGQNAFGAIGATSLPYGPITGSLPFNTILPAIIGTAKEGTPLTSTPGSWTGVPAPVYSYQWKRNGADIPGAFGSSYTPVALDVNTNLTLAVTGGNAYGAVIATSAPTAPVLPLLGDSTPNAFLFVDVINAPLASLVESNTVTITGINVVAPLTVSGGEYWIDAGPWATASTNIALNSTVKVRGVSSALNSTTTNVTLNVGGVTDTFSITTIPPGGTPSLDFSDPANSMYIPGIM